MLTERPRENIKLATGRGCKLTCGSLAAGAAIGACCGTLYLARELYPTISQLFPELTCSCPTPPNTKPARSQQPSRTPTLASTFIPVTPTHEIPFSTPIPPTGVPETNTPVVITEGPPTVTQASTQSEQPTVTPGGSGETSVVSTPGNTAAPVIETPPIPPAPEASSTPTF